MDPACQTHTPGIHLADDIVGRNQFVVSHERVDEVSRDRMLDDGIVVLVMQPVVELVSAGKAVDDGSVRLGESLRIISDRCRMCEYR